ncbi:aspartate aminotransferase family protein [Amycolatopsis sp. cmx-4-68]|uniref:class-III pyridoxal-phosphate-dependent aminotransferase n=1 Tax=Amycolatopsis sp. cmx-4-68 TaxID=2790938 RepID=UPI00397A42B7
MDLDHWVAASGSVALEDVSELTRRYVNPNKVDVFEAAGITPIMTKREGPYFWEAHGRRIFDAHSNGGTYNLGHRHPELVACLRDALNVLDIGNHHFLSGLRARLARELVDLCPGEMEYAVLCPSAADAIDVAVKSARRATGRRLVVSAADSYHGSTLGSMAAGDTRNAAYFRSGGSREDFEQAPLGDIDAMAELLERRHPAAVLLETIPATAGFPLPPDGYLRTVRDLCDRHGALLVLDEVQVGLGRTGAVWAVEHEGIAPDVLVTGKGLGGGLYPVAAAVMTGRAGSWLRDNGWGHGTTAGGSELGCAVALKVLEIMRRPETLQNVRRSAEQLREGLMELQARHPILVDIRQRGLVLALGIDHQSGGMLMTRHGFGQGLWAMFAAYDPRYLQLKPGLLLTHEQTDELLALLGTTLEAVSREVRQC